MSNEPSDHVIATVFGRVDDALRQEVAAFWLRQGAIADAREAHRRADELVCVARNRQGEVIGVNTAYVAALGGGAERWFHYRMFVRPQDRRLALSCALVRAAVTALRAGRHALPGIRGVALVTENPKLMRAGGRRLLAGLGWQSAGKGPHGRDLWLIAFAGS